MTWFVLRRKFGAGRHRMAPSRRRSAQVEGLESRNLMTAGSVVLTPGLVTVTPSSTGPNIAIVSYQNVKGTTMLDVNLNGTDHDFGLAQVAFVYYMGSGTSGDQTFQNTTSLHTVAWGGSGTNLFEGGAGQDEFIGGSGSNTFDAGSGYDVLIGGAGPNVFNESSHRLGYHLGVRQRKYDQLRTELFGELRGLLLTGSFESLVFGGMRRRVNGRKTSASTPRSRSPGQRLPPAQMTRVPGRCPPGKRQTYKCTSRRLCYKIR